MRLAVTGTQGQLARCLVQAAPAREIEVVALGRPVLDLGDPDTIFPAFAGVRPDVVVSAAAYTAVDQAETEPDLVHQVNARGAGLVAEAAARLGVPVIQMSTDYVFDGRKATPYIETDAVAPVSVYGASKLAGERAVATATPDHAILRTSWVYSPFGHNFVKSMLRLASSRDELAVVGDQIGNPSSALDLAEAVLTVARSLMEHPEDAELRGIFHLSGNGETNWADLARAVLRRSEARGGPFATVCTITTADYPTPAVRPTNSRLDCSKLAARYGVRMPSWQDSVDVVVDRLLAA